MLFDRIFNEYHDRIDRLMKVRQVSIDGKAVYRKVVKVRRGG